MSRTVFLDFETFWDESFTLKRLTTEEYIRSPRFETQILVALVDNELKPRIAIGEHIAELLQKLRLDDTNTTTVAHNAMFDGTIIEWRFGIRINKLVCTYSMAKECGVARLVGGSLSALADFFREQGCDIPRKGAETANSKGLHLWEFTPEFLQSFTNYCIDDTRILRGIYYAMLPLVSAESLDAINMTLQMYTRAVFELDKELLIKYKQKLADDKHNALVELSKKYHCDGVDSFLKMLRSADKFAALLESEGIVPPKKISEKKTATALAKNPLAQPIEVYAFSKKDEEFLELLDHHNPRIAALAEARIGTNSSIAESRTQSFIDIASRGPMPAPLMYAEAHTGRYGGGEKINVQNLPKRGGDKTLRKAICAPDGFEIGGADSSQIEARLLAYAANERWALDVFNRREDPYSIMAAKIYGGNHDEIKTYAKLDSDSIGDNETLAALHKKYKHQRDTGKETILASGYQMGAATFADRLSLLGIMLADTKEQHVLEAKKINTIYRASNPNIVNMWKIAQDVIVSLCSGGSGTFGGPDGKLFVFNGKHKIYNRYVPAIMLPNGYWIVYNDLRPSKNEKTGYTEYTYETRRGRKKPERSYLYGGKLVENIIQGWAFAILKTQALEIHKQIPVRLNVHDEWMSVYRPEDREIVKNIYITAMSRAPSYAPDLPLACEFSYGKNYGKC